MTLHMFDTNVLTEIVGNPEGETAKRFADLKPEEVCISVIVSSEVSFGLAKNTATKAGKQIRALLSALPVRPFEPPADRIYGDVRAELARRGRSMSPNDYFIVAHAIFLDAVLVTDDRAIHAAGVPGLKVENWLRA
ncbi:PIN domain-containing protein [Nitratireductor sp. GCM10026969]|uniref:PIN domain-containing protein n=1 Tax=Nitratireductor sp. GCM10026969 TaxID=3252645 RepID=UPI00361B7464